MIKRIFFTILGLLLLSLVGTVFAEHPPPTIITEYTYEDGLNPNEFIKWKILENVMKDAGYSYRVVQKDNQLILLRFYIGVLTGYAYYLDEQLYIYANGDHLLTHFMKEIVTYKKRKAAESWLDKYRNKISMR